MQFLLDNLSAVIILGVVALTVGVMQQRGQQATIEATVHDMVKAKAMAFAEVLEHDLQNLGTASRPESSPPDSSASRYHFRCEGDYDGDKTTRMRFSTTELPRNDAPTPINVTYEIVPVRTPAGQPRTVLLKGEKQPLYEVRRIVDGVPTGGSGAILTHFLIEVATRDANFQPVNGSCPKGDGELHQSDVKLVRVSFVAATAPVVRDAGSGAPVSDINVVRYGITLQPPGMKRF